MTEHRHASLKAEPTAATSAIVDPKGRRKSYHYVILTASNGEPLLYGETHPDLDSAEEAVEAAVRAMVDVLEERGYTVSPPASGLVDPLSTFADPGGE